MTLFRSQTHQEIWQMRWCHTCFQPDEAARRLHGKTDSVCPIWEKAMRTDRKPVEWDRKPRATDMDRTITCNSHTSEPPIIKRAKAVVEDVPLFDETPYKIDVGFVPVEGWPERESGQGVDHQ
jgi:hypothetical protein